MSHPHITPTTLDHLILLLPYATLQNLPSFFTDNFTITPGGQHADGLTENKLITLASGVYLELISFITPASREGHWWGTKSDDQGVIDWCLSGQLTPTLSPEFFRYDLMKNRLAGVQPGDDDDDEGNTKKKKISYADPRAGGRIRPDGKKVEWKVTFPTLEGVRPPGIPFFCHDVTDRALRTSTETEEAKVKYTTHACGATRVEEIVLLVSGGGEEVERWGRMIGAIAGRQVTSEGAGWRVNVAAHSGSGSGIVVKGPETGKENEWVERFGVGIYEIVLTGQDVTEELLIEGGGIRMRVATPI